MISRPRMLLLTALAASTFASFSSPATAAPVAFTLEFPGGFDVSINGDTAAPSGPILVRGVVNDTTADINPNSSYGEFPLLNVTFTGAGFFNQTVSTLLSLVVFDGENFAFQRTGEFNQGIIGWNGFTSSGSFMTNVNNLSTLGSLPYSTLGGSTFWYDSLGANAWTLAGGHTIGGNIGAGGPPGEFTIERIPEPSTIVMLLGIIGAGVGMRR